MPRHMRLVGRAGCKVELETPCKRRRRSKSISTDRSPPLSWATQQNDSRHVAAAGTSTLGLLTVDALTESLAMLDIQDILQSAMVCFAWQHAAGSNALWTLAAPHLGLARRIVQCEEISRRMSRGVVRCGVLLGGSRDRVALRTIDLRNVNAGQDDGLLPSIVREVAILQLLSSRKHPAIVNFIGAEIDGEQVHVVTEHLASSFEDWFCEPCPTSGIRFQLQICERFWQLFKGLHFLHASGVFHRNLTPGNVLRDPATGIVKICDFAYGRTLDTPLRAYSPEHPKLRPRSIREARRLWYKAPELLLRQSIYGPAIDIWSAACLLVEAACKEPLFPSEAEIDHLFRIFQLTGTPSRDLWPDALMLPSFSPKFPVYKPIDFNSVAEGCWWSNDAKDRTEVIALLSRCSHVLGCKGMDLLRDLLQLEPRSRCTAVAASLHLELQMEDLGIPYKSFKELCQASAQTPSRAPGSVSPDHASKGSAGEESEIILRVRVARLNLAYKQAFLKSTPQCSKSLFPPLWRQMAFSESMEGKAVAASSWSRVPDAVVAKDARAEHIDLMISVATQLEMSDFALHLGVALFDDCMQKSLSRTDLEEALIAVACLKLSETLDEHSFEYFQRERTDLYVSACSKRWDKNAILAAEKAVAHRLQFAFHRTTAAWFLRTCAHVGGQHMVKTPRVVSLACMFLDLSLLHPDSQAHPAPLRAQAALLLATHTALPSASASAAAKSLWAPVRRITCGANQREPVTRCLDHMVLVVFTLRERLRAHGLYAAEKRNKDAANFLLPPIEITADLAEQLLPVSD